MKRLVKALIEYFGYDIRARPRDRNANFEEVRDWDYRLLKSFAVRAAEYAATAQGRRAVRDIYLSGLMQDLPSVEYSRIELGDQNTLDVGIWRRERPSVNAAFIRRSDKTDEWLSWADVQKIAPKRAKWRVVLLGESVARGYLYDPQFNLETALSAALKSQLQPKYIEVVDLAKSNLSLQELKTCVGQSLALSPDMLVIFAGNNWRPQLTTPDLPYVQSILRQDGVPGMKAFLDQKRQHVVANLLAQVSQVLGSRGVKVIWVVPEFNLADWVDPASNAPQLPQQLNQRWRELDARTEQALRDGDCARARTLAYQMADLDGNTSSVPLRVLAECSRSVGDLEGARRYLELCRDAEGWDPSFSLSPRISSIVQDVLRQAASLPGNCVVDLPTILSRHLNGRLPDRSIFLDYCHLTSEGINVAAAAIASQAVAILTNKTVSPEMILRKLPLPSQQLEGKACFLAAIHNAHFYQRPEIIGYWCNKALKLWPKCAELMIRYIDYETRNLPIMACKSGMELFQLDELDIVRYLTAGRVRRLDLALCDAVTAAMEGTRSQVGAEIDRLRVEQHSPRHGPRELTDFYYNSAVPGISERCWTSRAFPNNRGSHTDYAAALWNDSLFLFAARRGENVVLKLTYRVPMTADHGMVAVAVNGRKLVDLPSQSTWCTRDIAVDGDWVVDGVNKVLVSWPTEEPPAEQVIERMIDELMVHRLPRFNRVFGEIHSLSAFVPTGSEIHRSSGSSVSPAVGETPG